MVHPVLALIALPRVALVVFGAQVRLIKSAALAALALAGTLTLQVVVVTAAVNGQRRKALAGKAVQVIGVARVRRRRVRPLGMMVRMAAAVVVQVRAALEVVLAVLA